MSYGCIKCRLCDFCNTKSSEFHDGCSKGFPAETPYDCSQFVAKADAEKEKPHA